MGIGPHNCAFDQIPSPSKSNAGKGNTAASRAQGKTSLCQNIDVYRLKKSESFADLLLYSFSGCNTDKHKEEGVSIFLFKFYLWGWGCVAIKSIFIQKNTVIVALPRAYFNSYNWHTRDVSTQAAWFDKTRPCFALFLLFDCVHIWVTKNRRFTLIF